MVKMVSFMSILSQKKSGIDEVLAMNDALHHYLDFLGPFIFLMHAGILSD